MDNLSQTHVVMAMCMDTHKKESCGGGGHWWSTWTVVVVTTITTLQTIPNIPTGPSPSSATTTTTTTKKIRPRKTMLCPSLFIYLR